MYTSLGLVVATVINPECWRFEVLARCLGPVHIGEVAVRITYSYELGLTRRCYLVPLHGGGLLRWVIKRLFGNVDRSFEIRIFVIVCVVFWNLDCQLLLLKRK